MAKLAQHVQTTVIPAQVVACVKLVRLDLDFKVINATRAHQELISMAKPAQHVQALVTPAQVALFVKLARQDMDYKVINVTPAP